MKTQVKLGLVLGGVGFLMLCDLRVNVMADSIATQVNVEVPSRLSITSSKSEINLNATPTPTGKFVWDYTTLTVGTNNETGYTLTMSDKDGDTNLKHVNTSVAATIPTLSGDKTKADFEMNKWGYTLLGAATEVQDSTNFSPVPVNTAAVTIGQSTGPVEAVATNVGMAAKVDTNLPSGVYKDTVTFSAVANYVEPPHQNLLPSLTSMQDANLASVCENTYKPTKDATETVTTQGIFDGDKVPEATLTDTRDGKTYVVRKLADGNCWMSQNLALSPDGNTTYTEADTDLHNGKTFQAPAASSIGTFWNGNGSDGPHYLNPRAGHEYFQNGTTASSTGQPTESAGNYYDWPMATAMSGQNLTNNGDEAPDSICPKGWRLPPDEGNKSYKNLLMDSYNVSTSSDAALLASPLSFVRAGYYFPTLGPSGGTAYRGVMLTSTIYESEYAHIFSFSDVSVEPLSYGGLGNGNSVRCVVR